MSTQQMFLLNKKVYKKKRVYRERSIYVRKLGLKKFGKVYFVKMLKKARPGNGKKEFYKFR